MSPSEEKESGAYQAMVALGDAVALLLASTVHEKNVGGKVSVSVEDLQVLVKALGQAANVLSRLGGGGPAEDELVRRVFAPRAGE